MIFKINFSTIIYRSDVHFIEIRLNDRRDLRSCSTTHPSCNCTFLDVADRKNALTLFRAKNHALKHHILRVRLKKLIVRSLIFKLDLFYRAKTDFFCMIDLRDLMLLISVFRH